MFESYCGVCSEFFGDLFVGSREDCEAFMDSYPGDEFIGLWVHYEPEVWT